MINIDEFNIEKECQYHGENYSVRDNGAVKRHTILGKPKRKLDDIWTFGKPNAKTGYMEIAGERVHRIVAFAFLGEPPNNEYVVDHIDTNRQNNRPENLRWLTRLENVLNNPITKARIETICGSVEAFLQNPSILRGHENCDPNFSWMRTVSVEEAKHTLENLTKWAINKPKPQGNGIGEWVFQEKHYTYYDKNFITTDSFDEKFIEINEEYPSLTTNVIQINWKTPTIFPLCPNTITDNPLEKYFENLKVNEVFSKNEYNYSRVFDFALSAEKDKLFIICEYAEYAVKPWTLTEVYHKEGIYYHKSKGSFFDEEGARKYFTIAIGREWTGGDVFDDFC